MIYFRLIRIRLSIGLRDALRDNLRVALLVAGELAVGTLHTSRILEKIAAKGASHDVIELLLDEFMAVLLVDFVLLLTHSTFATEPDIVGTFLLTLLHETQSHVNSPDRLEREP